MSINPSALCVKMDSMLHSQNGTSFVSTSGGYDGGLLETDGLSQTISSGSSQDVLHDHLPAALLKPLSYSHYSTPTPSMQSNMMQTRYTDEMSFTTDNAGYSKAGTSTGLMEQEVHHMEVSALNNQESSQQCLSSSQTSSIAPNAAPSQGGKGFKQTGKQSRNTQKNVGGKDALAEDKRHRRLIRNREAAKKNRSKKKEWIEGLQIRTTCLTEDNKGLLKKSEMLQNELNWLRSLLIRKGYSEISIPNV
jgi:hypothetical protein